MEVTRTGHAVEFSKEEVDLLHNILDVAEAYIDELDEDDREEYVEESMLIEDLREELV